MSIAQFLTDFADQAVVLPLAIWVGIGLLVMGWRRGALVWAIAIGGVLGTMLVLKMVFAACGWLLPFHDIHSPSGHTASAGAVYGGLAALILKRSHGSAAAMAWAVLFAVVVGLTRLVLGAHSLPEVIVGTFIGLAGTLVLVQLSGTPPATVKWPRIAGAGLVLMLLFHGVHLGAEAAIDRIALLYYWPLSACAR